MLLDLLPDDAPHILLVDDDRRIRMLMSQYLMRQGYRVTTAQHCAQARICLACFSVDLIVLDVMLPDETGFAFTRKLRQYSDVPILLLTAKTEAEDRVEGFEVGADDYLTKPFEPKELSLRIASILRRVTQQPLASASVGSNLAYHFGPFIFYPERAELWKGEERVRLTEREIMICEMLVRQPGEPVSRDELAALGPGGNERTIDVQINRLRRKLEPDPTNPRYLQTARGTGYRLVLDHV